MMELLSLLFGCGHFGVRTLELPMTVPMGRWDW